MNKISTLVLAIVLATSSTLTLAKNSNQKTAAGGGVGGAVGAAVTTKVNIKPQPLSVALQAARQALWLAVQWAVVSVV